MKASFLICCCFYDNTTNTRKML